MAPCSRQCQAVRIALVAGIMLAGATASCWAEAPLVSGIRAFHHGGQTFVQWEERKVEQWTTFNVYRSDRAITDIRAKDVECLARDIGPRSGRDFYVLKKRRWATLTLRRP